MKVSFPSHCRSFDASNGRVCFWGYDRTIEIAFFVRADTLRRLCPDMTGDGEEILTAFDAVRDRINEIADEVYARGGKGSIACILAVDD